MVKPLLGLRIDIQMAGCFRRLVPSMQSRGASECCKVGFVKTHFFAQVFGPGLHSPQLGPAIRSGDVFVKPPSKCPGAQPDLTNLLHRIEESFAICGIYSIVDRFQHPARVRMQQSCECRVWSPRLRQRGLEQFLRPCPCHVGRENAEPPRSHRRGGNGTGRAAKDKSCRHTQLGSHPSPQDRPNSQRAKERELIHSECPSAGPCRRSHLRSSA